MRSQQRRVSGLRESQPQMWRRLQAELRPWAGTPGDGRANSPSGSRARSSRPWSSAHTTGRSSTGSRHTGDAQVRLSGWLAFASTRVGGVQMGGGEADQERVRCCSCCATIKRAAMSADEHATWTPISPVWFDLCLSRAGVVRVWVPISHPAPRSSSCQVAWRAGLLRTAPVAEGGHQGHTGTSVSSVVGSSSSSRRRLMNGSCCRRLQRQDPMLPPRSIVQGTPCRAPPPAGDNRPWVHEGCD